MAENKMISIQSLIQKSDSAHVKIHATITWIQGTDKTFHHVKLSDGSISTEINARLIASAREQLPKLTKWSKVRVKGMWRTEERLLYVEELHILGDGGPSNPLNNEVLARKTHPHLSIRAPWHALLLRFRSTAISAIVDYFDNAPGGPFYQVHHPVITHTDCEGGAEVFPVLTQRSKNAAALQGDDFFGGRRYLTVTAAIHGEAFAMALDKVWMLSPCFRAERVQDTRHLAEFHMLEIAMNNIESLNTLFDLCEGFAHGLVTRLRNSKIGQELLATVGNSLTTSMTREKLEGRWNLLAEPNWPRISHADAVILMQEAEKNGTAFVVSPGSEIDFSTEHEMFLLEHFKRPVFVTHFPTKIRLFSALQSPPPTKPGAVQTTESLDLLLPGIAEVVSGGLREHRLEKFIEVMRKKHFFVQCEGKSSEAKTDGYPYLQKDESLDSLEWFADLRRWGTSPHGGVGFGFDRLLQYLTGAESVQDVVAFPRYFKECVA